MIKLKNLQQMYLKRLQEKTFKEQQKERYNNNFESETEVRKEIYITQEEKQQIIDELRLI